MSYWDMFATWVGANANNGTWYIGGVIAACGFLTASTTLIVAGIISYLLLAAASYMGYKTGLTAMTLTRASFGLRGSLLLPSLIWFSLSAGLREYVYCGHLDEFPVSRPVWLASLR